MNPCDYSVSTLKGHGLRDNDLIRAFARMMNGKIEKRKAEVMQWPCTPEEIIDRLDRGPLDRGPLKELYNVIYATIDDNFKVNEYGYAKTPSNQVATKVWSLASDWEALVVPKNKSGKQIVSGLTLHRLTGRKDVVIMMNKLGNFISYNDIRAQNQAWAKMVSSSVTVSKQLAKGIATHATIDNNDGRQDMYTGSGTTHDTNCTLFQPLIPGKKTENFFSFSTGFSFSDENYLLENGQ